MTHRKSVFIYMFKCWSKASYSLFLQATLRTFFLLIFSVKILPLRWKSIKNKKFLFKLKTWSIKVFRCIESWSFKNNMYCLFAKKTFFNKTIFFNCKKSSSTTTYQGICQLRTNTITFYPIENVCLRANAVQMATHIKARVHWAISCFVTKKTSHYCTTLVQGTAVHIDVLMCTYWCSVMYSYHSAAPFAIYSISPILVQCWKVIF